MITNKQILQEVEDLKLKLKSGETEIPSMWCCFWPWISVLLWMIGWPLIIYGYKMHFYKFRERHRQLSQFQSQLDLLPGFLSC